MTLLILAIGLAIFLFVIMPLIDGRSDPTAPVSPEKAEGPDAVLEQIEDLDLERASGKLPEEIYRRVRQDLVEEAAEILGGKK